MSSDLKERHKKWVDKLQIHDLLDVFDLDELVESWLWAHIIEINDNQIKINYYGYTKKNDEWIDKTDNKRLAPINTYTVPFILLKKTTKYNN